METRVQRSKRIRANWEEMEERINRMEDDFVEEAAQDIRKLAKAMSRSTSPFKSVDSLSDADRWAESAEFFRLYGDGIRGQI